MKLKLFICLIFVFGARCMKKGFLLNTQKKEQSFVCDICFENRFVSFTTQCNHKICGVCAAEILHRPNLSHACAMCRAKLSCIMKDYKVNFHNFDVLKAEEYLPASQSAIFAGKLSLLQKIVARGFDVRPHPVLILQAVEGGHLQIVKFLAKLKVNLHVSIGEANLVFVAAQYGHLETVKFLVTQGVNMNRGNSMGKAPIHIALINDYREIFKFLSNREEVKSMNQSLSPQIKLKLASRLYYASQEGLFDVVKFLVERGWVDVNTEDSIGATPIAAASAEGHLEIVKFLAKNGAKIDHVQHDGATPLYHATYEGRFDVVEFLVGKGADVNKSHESGATPIEMAIDRIHISPSHAQVAIFFAILNIHKKE